MLFPDVRGHGIIIEKIKLIYFIHNQGVRLYGIKKTREML